MGDSMLKKRNMYLIIVFITALVIGVGYAILNSNLNIAGSTKVKDNIWNIHFENVNVTSGSVSAPTPTINNGTNVTYTLTLNNPGDFYEFTVDVKNSGTIDAMIGSISNTGLTTEQKKYMDYTATYSDGIDIEEKQELKANKKETIKVRVEFKKDIDASDLPSENQTLNLTLNMNYVQRNNTSKIVRNIVCKRATILHTEVCNYQDGCANSGAGYNIGDTITYGMLGTTDALSPGDAFDCDVNKDGTYNANTERFYYVTDLDTDSNYAVLIYYNNVSGGEPNNTTSYAYDSSNTPRSNGPVTLLSQLPTTSQWNNVSLSSTTRKIKDETGGECIDFSYAGYAARLLTMQEVQRACNIVSIGTYTTGELDTCKYLLENTKYSNGSLKYGWLLENPHSSFYNLVWDVNGSDRSIYDNYSSDDSYDGVRPAIEVPKNKISY